jgi:dipeptidyl aminopeptidase/acylaminoacyl peptidase
VLASTSHEPSDVHAGPPGGKLTRLSDTRPELRRIRLGTQERLAYQASDGLNLDGILVLPVGQSRQDGPVPLVTMVHGGPYDRHADQFYGGVYPAGQWLAAAGYAAFLPNPRGGSGHGQQFAAAVAGRVGLEEWTDIVSGIDVLIADGVADPDRLGIGGASHGGFMAAWAIGQTRRFKAALMATPVLILHGQDDTNVPLFVVYPREGHGTAERNHQLDVLRRTRAWFDRWLRDPAPDQGTSGARPAGPGAPNLSTGSPSRASSMSRPSPGAAGAAPKPCSDLGW